MLNHHLSSISLRAALLAGFSLFVLADLHAQKPARPVPPVRWEQGRLMYQPDSMGDRIPDFSHAGYMGGDADIPIVKAVVYVPARPGDATLRIQSAIDHVSKRPPDATGFRGAVLLGPGRHDVAGSLKISESGVVLRGSGIGAKGTILRGTGRGRETLVRLVGRPDRRELFRVPVTVSRVPVGSRKIRVQDAHRFKAGDQVILNRPSVQSWIDVLGTGHFGGGITALGWKPGDHDLRFDRTIESVVGDVVMLDAPITTAVDSAYGGGQLIAYEWPGRLDRIGIENITLESEYDPKLPKDEDHRWMAITIENARDAWVRQVVFRGFAGSAVMVLSTARRVTVEDCISESPVSEVGGERRNTFFTEGQQTLFQRCVASDGIHDFATGQAACGPNAFVQCASYLPHGFSGALGGWASGTLYDLVTIDGEALRLGNRGQDGNGAGWAAANSLTWNCSAARIDCYRPPTAQNWSFGSWAQFAGDGYWAESNNTISPYSFYHAQLSQRRRTDGSSRLLRISTEASSSPSVETALKLAEEALKPALTLRDWILKAASHTPIPTDPRGLVSIDDIIYASPLVGAALPALEVKNGWLVRDGMLLTGRRADIPWWSGSLRGKALAQAKPALTRFVPGRIGTGYTDDLEDVASHMQASNTIGIEQHYGLWYDRRRDDHQRVRRMDGDAWAPFYELPFARSGQGTAWDGLSKYDLTKYNHWYWDRLKKFADIADKRGLILIHQQYFQHNIIEAGAHYADFPWRSANNINGTGFPEPVNYAGDKRIFMATPFYDTTHPVRRDLHRRYIWQCLDNFRDQGSVIQLIGEEFTGPLHFVQFWLDAVRGWELKQKRQTLTGLSVTKDVQDAILSDLVRSRTVDIIDIRYWHYETDGDVYAPAGGQSLAPRQHARLLKPQRPTFSSIHRAVREYATRYPGKAIMFSADNASAAGWAVLIGGGSLPVLPATTEPELLKAVVSMRPDSLVGAYALSGLRHVLVHPGNGSELAANLTLKKGQWMIRFIDPTSGRFFGDNVKVEGGVKHDIRLPALGALAFLTKLDPEP
jgi:hypothetical protein